MKTHTQASNPETANLDQGLDILRKADSHEKQAGRYHGQYVLWARKGKVRLESIAGQFQEVKGWKPTSARNAAKGIILLGDPENRETLEDLMNGKIDLSIARARVTSTGPRPTVKQKYEDDEAAVNYLQNAIGIMIKRHANWKAKDFLCWMESIAKPLIAQQRS